MSLTMTGLRDRGAGLVERDTAAAACGRAAMDGLPCRLYSRHDVTQGEFFSQI